MLAISDSHYSDSTGSFRIDIFIPSKNHENNLPTVLKGIAAHKTYSKRIYFPAVTDHVAS